MPLGNNDSGVAFHLWCWNYAEHKYDLLALEKLLLALLLSKCCGIFGACDFKQQKLDSAKHNYSLMDTELSVETTYFHCVTGFC